MSLETRLGSFKPGDEIEYTEDGSLLAVKVLEIVDQPDRKGYKLEVIRQDAPHPFCKDAEPGEVFEAVVNPEYADMAYGGMWRLHPKGTYGVFK